MLYRGYCGINQCCMRTEVNLEIYNLIELLLFTTFQNTEAGISLLVNCKRVKNFKVHWLYKTLVIFQLKKIKECYVMGFFFN